MNKKLYKPLTVFVHQTDSKQLQTPIWQKRCKAGRELIRGLNPEDYEHWITWLSGYENAYRWKRNKDLHYEDDYYTCEPLELKAIRYAVSIRFFCLPWTLAISIDEAESCGVNVLAIAIFIEENFQIKVKLTK